MFKLSNSFKIEHDTFKISILHQHTQTTEFQVIAPVKKFFFRIQIVGCYAATELKCLLLEQVINLPTDQLSCGCEVIYFRLPSFKTTLV